ncbi:MAG TPA: septal ring lytic transglycosylase RlpA family protein [Terriglobales bacterium]|nr:septal ring lytic transglycosylase RlpA family protein [Terriglobales bacterium]
MKERMARGLVSVLVVVGVGAAQRPSKPSSKEMQVVRSPHAQHKTKYQPYQVGTASWYGSYFEGRLTASGEPFNMDDLTAAHPTLPLGSLVRVTNLQNGRRTYVRINDRGPVVEGRIIDLSRRAAEILQFKGQGLQQVRLELITTETEPDEIAMLHSAY